MSENRSLGGLPNSPQAALIRGKNHFFAIGISSYTQFTPLANARKDIENLAQILKEDYSFDQQTLLFDDEATRANIINTLSELRQTIQPDDKLIIYYSGHGTEDDFDGYWIPIDAQKNEVSTFVTNADITNRIKAINARHILLISDSCFSASLLEQGRSLAANDTTYDEMEKTKSRWAFVSGKAVVSDGDPGSNSPFAKGIIKHLERTTDKINISLLADQVTKEVGMNYSQQPIALPLTFVGGEYGGQFIFVKKQTEQDDWATARSEDDEGAYLAYQKKYPNGKYVQEAEHRLLELADENEWTQATFRNAAIDYKLYLKKYERGIHAEEAKSRLDEIVQQDLKDKEEKRKKEQEKVFEHKKQHREEKITPTPSAQKPLKSNRYYYLLALIGVLIFGTLLTKNYYDKDEIQTLQVDTVDQLPVTSAPPPPTVTSFLGDSTRKIEGMVTDDASNSLAGTVVRNQRTGDTVKTDEFGHFFMEHVLVGDSLMGLKDENYIGTTGIVGNERMMHLVLEVRSKTNRTITGKVMYKNGTGIKGAVVLQYRAGTYIKTVTTNNSSGSFILTKVNDGDVICVKWLPQQKPYHCKKEVSITAASEYNFIVD